MHASQTASPRFGAIYKLTPKARRELQGRIDAALKAEKQSVRDAYTRAPEPGEKRKEKLLRKSEGWFAVIGNAIENGWFSPRKALEAFMLEKTGKPAFDPKNRAPLMMMLAANPLGLFERERKAGTYILTDESAKDGAEVPAWTEFHALYRGLLGMSNIAEVIDMPEGPPKEQARKAWDRDKTMRGALIDAPKVRKQAMDQLLEKYKDQIEIIE